MTNPAIDVDQVLKDLASQSVMQGSNVRAAASNRNRMQASPPTD